MENKRIIDIAPDQKYLALVFSGRHKEALEYRRQKIAEKSKSQKKPRC